MSEANGPSNFVAKRVATSIFKAKGWPGVVMFDLNELTVALEYGIDIYSGNAEKVFGIRGATHTAIGEESLDANSR